MVFSRTHPGVRGLCVVVVLTFLLSTVDWAVLATAAAADSPREELTKAEDYFLVADFATALAKVDALIASGDLEGGALRDAYVLQARCEVGLAHRSAAIDAFCNALRVDSGWRPDPDFYTTDEIEIFEQAKGSCREGATGSGDRDYLPPPMSEGGTPWYKNWKIVGPVAAGVVVLGIVLLSGGDDDGDPILDDFPPPPAN